MRFRIPSIVLSLAALAACSHAQPVAKTEPPAPPPVVVAPAPSPPVAQTPPETACSTDDQCARSELCEQARCVAITAGMEACTTQTVHFEFDRADLSQADRNQLQRSARCLEAVPADRALVDGDCDERGTAEYNVALGFKRAHSVASYLENLGVSTSQLSEVSYGEEIPLCKESTEDCWAMNRRADVTRGATPRHDVADLIRADEQRDRNAHTAPQAKADP